MTSRALVPSVASLARQGTGLDAAGTVGGLSLAHLDPAVSACIPALVCDHTDPEDRRACLAEHQRVMDRLNTYA